MSVGSIRSVTVCNKNQNDVEQLCSHVTAAATHHAPPAANEGRHPKHCPSNSHLHPTTTDAPKPAGPRTELWLPARASALACMAQTSGFRVTFCSFLLFPSVLPGVNAHSPDVSAAAASSRIPDVKCRSYTVLDGDSGKMFVPSWRGRH